jgi:hypothetical protein
MYATIFLASALVAPADDARAADRERASALVEKLADSSFKVREGASDDLVKLGAVAVDALRKGLKHADTEVAERCRKLLPQALDFHLQEQIDKFLAKPDGPIPDDLPGLKRWLKVAGSTKESRELYAAMVKDQRRILIEVEAHPEQAAQKFQAFIADVYSRARVGTVAARGEMITRSEMVLYFFLGGDPACRKANTPTGSVQATPFLNGTQVENLLTGGGSSPAFQKLFLAWLEEERYITLVRSGFRLAALANLKEAAPIAIRVATDKTSPPTSRSYALLTASKLFTAADIKTLQPVLEDKTLITRIGAANGDPTTVEIRDIALAIAIQATGQKVADYGYDRMRAIGAAPPLSYTYYSQTEKQREAAFKKWQEWTENKK